MPSNMLDRVVSASQPGKLKALFYGPPGSGKTVLGGTAPKVLVLDVEGGTMSLRKNTPAADVFPIKTMADFDDAIFTLGSTKHKYESVFLDSITYLLQVAEGETDLLKDFTTRKDPRSSYGQASAVVRHRLKLLYSLDMNVIVSAQLRFRDEDLPEEGKFLLQPDVTPSVMRTLTALPDVIGRTFIRSLATSTMYGVEFGPSSRAVCKQRDLDLPKEVQNLTIPKLIGLIDKQKGTK